ncbi:MAG: hypothetical protein ABJB02_06375 [Dokdonella sp.]
MNTRLLVAAVSVALGVVGSVFATSASACGVPDFSQAAAQAMGLQAFALTGTSLPQASMQITDANLANVAAQENANGDDWSRGRGAIVGMWLFTFTMDNNPGNVPPIPAGTQVDTGFQTWHADGTELMNSGGRAPATSAFCQGVWTQKGNSAYTLNHWAISWDPNSNFVGPANIREQVTVDKTGNSFSGTFSIDQYISPPPAPGNLPDLTNLSTRVAHLTGAVTGKRVTP